MFNQSPYGSQSIFSGLPPPPATSAGPIATPISTGNKTKKLAALPQYKINPIMAARLVTPQKRGYGFSYSNYGTPSSVSSISSTPGGFGSSLLGSSIGRSFGKSLSTSNLRRTFDNDADSVLSPGAFSAGSARYGGGGSMKKLTIDRSLRTDLFGSQALAALPSPERSDTSRQSSILKKKVSFDSNAVGGNGASVETNGSGNHYPDEENSATPSAQEQGYLRSSSRANGRSASKANSTPAQPEMEQVKGNELAIVHEDGSPENTSLTVHQGRSDDQFDPEPGQYYIRPSREELKKLPKDQLKKVSGFCIGREDCGHVVFDQPVDLTTVDLDNVFDNICVITLRSLTVYPDQTKKPLLGKGLNVPSTITLRNSWPRQRDRKTPSYEKSGIKFNKHVDRLRKVTGTEFVNYNKDTGEWIFRVPHFTTYGFDYEDEGDTLQSSMLSELPDTPTPKSRTPKANPTPMSYVSEVEGSSVTESSQFSSGPDDTFEFKKKKLFPGAFDDVPAFDDTEMEEIEQDRQSFLDERSALSASDNGDDEPSDVMEDSEMQNDSLVIHDDERMVIGSFPQQDVDDEPFQVAFQASHFGIRTPGKSVKDMGSDWMQQLQRTISPRKQDRQALKESQALLFKEHDMDLVEMPKSIAPVRDGSEIVTSIDLMNSLFGQEQLRKSGRAVKKGGKAKGFEVRSYSVL
jgi:nuclear pore complex protein Nup98-Nup96